jgi:hypothetical protein
MEHVNRRVVERAYVSFVRSLISVLISESRFEYQPSVTALDILKLNIVQSPAGDIGASDSSIGEYSRPTSGGGRFHYRPSKRSCWWRPTWWRAKYQTQINCGIKIQRWCFAAIKKGQTESRLLADVKVGQRGGAQTNPGAIRVGNIFLGYTVRNSCNTISFLRGLPLSTRIMNINESESSNSYCSKAGRQFDPKCDDTFPTYALSPFRYRAYAEMAVGFFVVGAGMLFAVGSWTFDQWYWRVLGCVFGIILIGAAWFIINHAAVLGDACFSSSTIISLYDA